MIEIIRQLFLISMGAINFIGTGRTASWEEGSLMSMIVIF